MQILKNITGKLASLSVTVWVGSLWSIGYLAVPVLFYAQPDKQLAGMLAGQMFIIGGEIGLVCGAYLLMQYVWQSGQAALRQQLFWTVVLMLLMTALIQFGIQPLMSELKVQALPLDVMHSPFAAQFKMLHGISSIAYLVESLLGAFLVIKSTSR